MGYTLEQLQKLGATPVASKGYTSDELKKLGARPLNFQKTEEPKETILGNLKSVAKNIPGAAKQIIKTAVTNPIKTIQAVTAGAGDVGVGAFNTLMAASDKISNIAGTKPNNIRLPSLTKAFSEAQSTQEKQDILGAIGEGSKMYSSFALGQKGVDKFISNPVLRGVVGNVVGGQMVTDPGASLKDRSTQALFDAAFGAITEGAGPLTKKLFGKKVPPPKEKLTAEQYSASQGYEPIIPDEQLPVIKMGKTPKEKTVKYGKSNPNVFDEGFTAPDGQPPLPTKSVLQDKGQIEAPSVESPIASSISKAKASGQSFDEWAKGQGQVVYHGGDKIQTINPNKSNYAKTFFVTDNIDYAKGYVGKGQVLNDIYLKPEAKLIDIRNAPKDVIAKIRELGSGKETGKILEIKRPDGTVLKIPEKVGGAGGYGNLSFEETLDGAIRGKSHYAEDLNLVEIYKKLGYDGMISYEDVGMRGKNIGIWNKNVAKTKSQLKAEWDGVGKSIPKQQSFDDLIKEKATPKFKEEVVELSKQLDDIPGYTPKQKVREVAAFKNYLDSGNEQHLLDVGKGLIKDENLSNQSAFKLLEEHYDKTGQYEKLLDLSKSNIPSQSGQNLSLLNQGEGAGGAASVLSKARIIKEQALLKKGIDVEKEITQHLDDAVKDIRAGKDVNSVIDDLIDSFTCI